MPRKPEKREREDDSESIESRSTDGSDNGSDLEGFVVDEEDTSSPKIEASLNEDEEALKEAERIAQGLSVAQVGKYCLRDRSKIRKVETYFDKENALLIQKEQDKREMIQLLKKWKKSGEYVTEKDLGKKSTYEDISEEYYLAKKALNLPDSDIESEEEEEEDEESSINEEDLEDEEDEEDDEDEEDEDDEEDEEDEEDEDDEEDKEEDLEGDEDEQDEDRKENKDATC